MQLAPFRCPKSFVSESTADRSVRSPSPPPFEPLGDDVLGEVLRYMDLTSATNLMWCSKMLAEDVRRVSRFALGLVVAQQASGGGAGGGSHAGASGRRPRRPPALARSLRPGCSPPSDFAPAAQSLRSLARSLHALRSATWLCSLRRARSGQPFPLRIGPRNRGCPGRTVEHIISYCHKHDLAQSTAGIYSPASNRGAHN